jgi:hypothetical protein
LFRSILCAWSISDSETCSTFAISDTLQLHQSQFVGSVPSQRVEQRSQQREKLFSAVLLDILSEKRVRCEEFAATFTASTDDVFFTNSSFMTPKLPRQIINDFVNDMIQVMLIILANTMPI